ncbi:MAG: hypothetical protein LUO93_01080 [Methanomicrobiales archaeon]|nr:hypothetical protein [Methanomicrobiales archaeon]
MPKRLPPFKIGTPFGDWEVIEQLDVPAKEGNKSGTKTVMSSRVRCVCGTEKILANSYLRTGNTNGCGCSRARAMCASSTKHGKSNTPNHKLWSSIKWRIANLAGYADVKMHPEWVDDFPAFDAFIETLGPKPTPKHTLDRMDASGNYAPGNLRWADKSTQSANRRPFDVAKNLFGGDRHGKSGTPAYRLWCGVKYRIANEKSYVGIKMHGPWIDDFEAFEAYIESLGPKPTPEHTLDRINPAGDYAPGNLRWADKTLQSENRRNNMRDNLEVNSIVKVDEKYDMLTVLELVVFNKYGQNWYGAKVRCDCGNEKVVYQKQLLSPKTKSCGCYKNKNLLLGHEALEKPIEANGESMSMTAWAEKLGCSKQVIWNRINKLGWDPARAVTEPAKERLIEVDGVSMTPASWARKTGVPANVITKRIDKHGWAPALAVSTPTRAYRDSKPNVPEEVVASEHDSPP